MDVIIDKTISLWKTSGVVHIEFTGLGMESSKYEQTHYMEIDAEQLLDDLPSLHRLCVEAIEEKRKDRIKKYKEFKKSL